MTWQGGVSLKKIEWLPLTPEQYTAACGHGGSVGIQAHPKAVFLGAVSSYTLTFQKNTLNSISLFCVLYGFLYILLSFSSNWWFRFPHLSFMNGLIFKIQIYTQRNAYKHTQPHIYIYIFFITGVLTKSIQSQISISLSPLQLTISHTGIPSTFAQLWQCDFSWAHRSCNTAKIHRSI